MYTTMQGSAVDTSGSQVSIRSSTNLPSGRPKNRASILDSVEKFVSLHTGSGPTPILKG
jgi:hypothetical protein